MTDKDLGMDASVPEEQLTAKRGDSYLLAIAIDEYQHCPRLYNCVRDAVRMIDVLTSSYQFEKDKVIALFNEEATEANIQAAFRRLIKLVGPEDNLVVLYSGHGEYESDIDEGYWLPVEARLGQNWDYIANGRIIKYIKAIKAHHILLIADSCFSGSLFASRNIDIPTSAFRLDAIASRWLLTAGRNEVVTDGKPGDHSPFADNIIYFLEKNEQPSLSVTALIQQVTNAVTANARQTPRGEPLQDVGHRGGQFHFHKKGVLPPPPVKTAEVPARADIPAPAPVGFFQKHGKKVAGVAVILAIMIALFPILNSGPEEAVEATNEKPDVLVPVTPPDTMESVVKEEVVPVPEEVVVEEKPKTPPRSRDQLAWEKALTTDTEKAFRAYLSAFPGGKFVEAARERIAAVHRYRLDFTTSLKRDQLTIHINRGKPPFRVEVTYPPSEQKIVKNFNATGPHTISLADITPVAGSPLISIIVRDHNFKARGQKMPYNER